MCGICFCISGINIDQHVCNFNIFQRYAQNPFVESNEDLKKKYLNDKFDFIENIKNKNLFINDFTIDDIQKSIGPRGPNAMSYRQFEIINDNNSINNSLKCCDVSNKNNNNSDQLFSRIKKETFINKNNNVNSQENKDKLLQQQQSQVEEVEEQKTQQEQQLKMTFCNSLLHLRGNSDELNIQPFVNENQKSIFIYNGEIFVETLNSTSIKDGFNPFTNDTEQIYSMLNKLCEEEYEYIKNNNDKERINSSTITLENKITNILQDLQGDYAFVYYNNLLKKLFIAKDPFGKRSLLLGFTPNGFTFSSCSINVDENKLIKEADDEDGSDETPVLDKVKEEIEITDKKTDLIDDKMSKDIRYNMKDPEQRIQFLEKKYLHDYFVAKEKEWIEVPMNTLIVIDMQDTSKFIWDAYLINHKLYNFQYNWNENTTPIMNAPEDSINIVLNALKQSVKDHVQNIIQFKPYFKNNLNQENDKEQQVLQDNSKFIRDNQEQPILYQQTKFNYNINQTSSNVCVLFSGGLDSTLLTLFLDQLLPPNESIDLFNLSFKEDASDRLTALSALDELQNINPNRQYNLILIDKTVDDLDINEKSLLKLIYPRITHMDFNIALVLHLATKGQGYLHHDKINKNIITSGASVVLSGLGADEIFGGYSRYRVAFQRSGYPDLVQEMKFDLQRLWIRNLGRDDRAISQNGREVRFPFLNQNLIQTVTQNIDFSYFTNFSLPRGTGDKILLRQVAKSLGLFLTSGFRKKAIQFGTGIAKQSNIRTFGSNRKAKGSFKYGLKEKK